MSSDTTSLWGSVERWSATLVLVGGGLLVGHAAMLGVRSFTDVATPPDVFGPTGHLVALAGLFGLYPVLVDRMPRASRAAGVAAAVALAGWLVLSVVRFLAVTGVVASVSAVLPGALVVLVFGSTVLTYALFGAISLRVDDESRTVGGLVLAPGILLVAALVTSAGAGASDLVAPTVGSGLALSVLALGFTLRTRDGTTGSEVPASGTMAR